MWLERSIMFVLFLLNVAHGAYPTGDGEIGSNFFIQTGQKWIDTDGNPIQCHSGWVVLDNVTDAQNPVWYWVGNADKLNSIVCDTHGCGGQNTQLNLYSSANTYGPWKYEGVIGISSGPDSRGVRLPGITVFERPKLHKDGSNGFYLFVHLDDGGYATRRLGVFYAKTVLDFLESSRKYNTVWFGRPGENKNNKGGDFPNGAGFSVLDFSIFYDAYGTKKLYYMPTTDSFRFSKGCQQYANGSYFPKNNMCANTAVVFFEITLDPSEMKRTESFTPRQVLPGRWEGMTSFRKGTSLYFLASGQDGFGPNPVTLFKIDVESTKWLPNTDASMFPAPTGGFTCLGSPFSGSMQALNSQPTQVLPNPYLKTVAGKTQPMLYIGDNWLHGFGRGSSLYSGQEPGQGDCPRGWPKNTAPQKSDPGESAGYIWLPFDAEDMEDEDKTLTALCALDSWNMKNTDWRTKSCYTFNIMPTDNPTTCGDGPCPVIVGSCGFSTCPGFTQSTCAGVGDAFTQAKYQGECSPEVFSKLHGVDCRSELKNFTTGLGGNIPSGDGGCKRKSPTNWGRVTPHVCVEHQHGATHTWNPCMGPHNY